ncbi:hypothetical protein [Amycolatopsis sp. YIM 10]|uniref:hypothetical protein n=1 Tax=Amycolatopsis sp. YIM 10 TaxID=2653857 RepID=UPI00128FFC1B|nr:hypothetical protein [Amycolatopsis sp. YIM 10]QFU87893.1 hypothetical protein YIM_13535 [Amycolatopsis sp. YIM 10]QFU94794.1 hypothetical protein YIM_48345 [Amycolatopsis sp. YIM 10]
MTESARFQPETRDDILGWLAGMDSLTRARVAGLLVDRPTIEAVGAARREAVWELSREHGGKGTAALLGVGTAAVHKAVVLHNKAVNARVQG